MTQTPSSGRKPCRTLLGVAWVWLLSAAWGTAFRVQAEPRYAPPFPGDVPAHTSAALDARDQKIWFYGGVGPYPTGRLADLWSFDLEAGQWEKAAWTGESPPRLLGHGMVYDPEAHRLLLFGGSQLPTYIGDWFCNGQVWEFDLETDRWEIAFPSPHEWFDRMPIVRDPSDGSIWAFFGTCDDHRPTRAYTHLDLKAQQQTVLFAPSDGPRHRMNHVAIYDPRRKRALVFGGGTQSDGCLGPADCAEFFRKLTIVWVFDPPTNTWTSITDGRDRWPQDEAVGAYDSNSDLLLVRGGVVGDLAAGQLPYLSDEVWGFDPNDSTWSVLTSQQGLAPRRNAGGTYCPCQGELFVIGGWTTYNFTYPSQEEAAFFVPIERPAEFSWDGAAASDRRASGQRWGTLRFPEGSQEVERFEEGSVRLVNCETEKTLHMATEVKRIGHGAWHVRFEELGAEVDEAQAKGRLILTGRPAGAPVNFLARLPKSNGQETPPGWRDGVRPTAKVGAEAANPGLQVVRVPGGWEIRWAGAAAAEQDLRVYDVAGRLRLRRDVGLRTSESGAAIYHWDGRDEAGRPLPKGLYFVRATAGPKTATAKVFLW